MNKKILFGIPPRAHISLALDEVAAMKKQGYHCETIVYGRNDKREGKLKKTWNTIRNAFRLVSKLKSTQADFLYLNSRFEPVGSIRDFITLKIVKSFYKNDLKIIIKSHGSDCTVLERQSFLYKKKIIPFLVNNVDSWIFLSHDEKEAIRNHKPLMADRVHVLPNIIVPERCQSTSDFRKKYHLPTNKFICLFVGRMVRVKGVFDILESILHLHTPEKFHFIFVGNGDDEAAMKQNASDMMGRTGIQFTGYIPDEECDGFYSNADVLIYPTFDTEGFPMALFKSVACGVPVITTRIRAAKDYLSEPENVLWVQEKSPKEIARKLEKLYLNNSLRAGIMDNNLLLGRNFSPEMVGRQMADQVFGSNKKHGIVMS